MTEGESAPRTRAAARAARTAGTASTASAASATLPSAARGARGRRAAGGRFGWVRAASDRVPTTWLAGAATVVFLGATAAFGGLATAAEPGTAAIEPGAEHRNDQFAFTVESAQLRDADPDAGIYLDEGERLLSVRVRVENVFAEPQAVGDLVENIAIDGIDAKKLSVVRVDDGTFVSRLQPDVPAEVEFRLRVGAGDYRDGDVLHLTLNDLSYYVGSFVMSGAAWVDPEPVAEMSLIVHDTAAAS